ncbi:hypothetical protein [Actinoplanes sp. NPDC051851]|uniref:hypothetical protein n=1 Tax=Actinoplanes sp. NPDC051851 TaxID=3154753 RepID=UPI00342D0471
MAQEQSPPGDVIAAAGAWLGTALKSSGFRWVPGQLRLERRPGKLIHQVHFQPNRHNKPGELVKVGTILNVRDEELRRWRRINADRILGQGDLFCAHLLGYASGRHRGHVYGEAADGDIDLTDPATRAERLESFAAVFRGAVVPWFDEASSPDLIVNSRAGDYTNRPSALVEWLASRHRPDLIEAYVYRYLSRIPDAQPRYEAGWAKAAAGVPSFGLRSGDMAEELGWSVGKVSI